MLAPLLNRGRRVAGGITTRRKSAGSSPPPPPPPPPAPVFTVRPSISGTLRVGQVLTGSDGTITGSTSVTRRWLSAATSGGTYSAISGATGTTYTQVQGDVGRYLRLEVTATGAGGSTVGLSDPVGPVAPSQLLYDFTAGTAPSGVTLYRSSSAGYRTSTAYAMAAVDELRIETATTGDVYALVEALSTNLVVQTEALDNAAWTKNALTIAANAANAPTGAASADQAIGTSASGAHQYSQSVSVVSGQTYCWSQFVKVGGETVPQLRLSASFFPAQCYANFDLANGVVATTGAGAAGTAIRAVGGGWYRITLIATATATGSTPFLLNLTGNNGSAGFAPTVLGSGLDLYVWGLALRQESTPSSYSPSAGTAAQRGADQLLVDTAALGSGPFKVTVNKAPLSSTTFADQVYTSVSASAGLIDVSALTGAARIKSVKIEV